MKPELSCEIYHFKEKPRDSSNGPEIRTEAFLAPRATQYAQSYPLLYASSFLEATVVLFHWTIPETYWEIVARWAKDETDYG